LIGNKISKDELKKKLFVEKVHSDKTYELLVLGDSRVYRGVSMSAFEDSLGLSSFNIGFSAVIYTDDYFGFVEEKLDLESEKPTLLLGISPHSLTRYTHPNGHIHQIKKIKREEVLRYKYLLRITSVFSPYTYSEVLKLIQGKNKKDGFIQDFYFNDGWIYSDYDVRFPNSALKSYSSTFKNRIIDQDILNNLLDKIKEWKQKGYDVYAFLIPSSYNMETLERLKSGFSDNAIAKDFIGSGANWIRLDSVYRSYDGSHLIGEDAIRLSRVLAHKIKTKDYDTIYNDEYQYKLNYIPLNPPKLSSFYDFKASKFYFENEGDNNIGIVDNSEKFFNLSRIETSEIISKNINRIISSGEFKILEENKSFVILYEIVRNNKILMKSKLDSEFILEKDKWIKMVFDYEIPIEIREGDVVKTYIFNPYETQFLMKDLKVLYY
jgi:hypothetical protein